MYEKKKWKIAYKLSQKVAPCSLSFDETIIVKNVLRKFTIIDAIFNF